MAGIAPRARGLLPRARNGRAGARLPPDRDGAAPPAHRPGGRRPPRPLPAGAQRRPQRRPPRPLRRLLPPRPPRARSHLDRHARRPLARMGRGARHTRAVIGLAPLMKKRLLRLLAWAVTAGLLILLFKRIPFHEVVAAARGAAGWTVPAAFLFGLAIYLGDSFAIWKTFGWFLLPPRTPDGAAGPTAQLSLTDILL